MIDPELGWRLAFLTGAALGLVVFFMRMWLPESPRWLMTHGRAEEAERIVDGIEAGLPGYVPPTRSAAARSSALAQPYAARAKPRARCSSRIAHGPASVSMLMAAQAFFYNAIFFTYALVLTDFFGIASDQVGLYILPFAIGNFLGPVLLGRLFDTIGRRQMIFFTYLVSGLLLALTGYLFMQGVLTAFTQTLCWMVIFFFASAAASSAYLTVSETFPLEVRALAIAIFYAIGTGIGGIAGPLVFGMLIESGSRTALVQRVSVRGRC